jgi:putative tryptophan/tyrosine transport system substrate-binding protein
MTTTQPLSALTMLLSCHTRRRDFITLSVGAAIGWPLAPSAQQRVSVLGYLSTGSSLQDAERLAAFRQGMGEIGYFESRNAAIEYRWADGEYDRLPGLAAELVQRQVAVIAAAGGLPGVQAAKKATNTVPIVFLTGVDPVTAGLVASLNRPGGNLTGVTTLGNEVGPKRLELLHELVPAASKIALLVNPTNPNFNNTVRDLQRAAGTLGLQIHILHASNDTDVGAVFPALAELGTEALVIANDPFFIARTEQLGALSLRQRVPTIFYTRQFAVAGGLMSYGGDLLNSYRQVGVYAARILNGEKPADLPVQQSTKVELFINLKTARALGLDIPATLLALADEVIE